MMRAVTEMLNSLSQICPKGPKGGEVKVDLRFEGIVFNARTQTSIFPPGTAVHQRQNIKSSLDLHKH